MPLNKGGKYGREMVRAISDPHSGMIISDTCAAALGHNGAGPWLTLVAASRMVEGATIKALAGNSGTIYVTGEEANTDGFPLAAGETVDIMTNDLFKIKVYAPNTADGFAWLAMEQARATNL